MPQPARLPARLVLALGLGAAAALVIAACLELGDPGAAALDRQEVEARSVASLARAGWRERLLGAEPIAETVATHRVATLRLWSAAPWRPPAAPAAPGNRAASPEAALDLLRIQGASASAAAGQLEEARRQLVTVIDGGSAQGAAALLLLCRIEAGSEGGGGRDLSGTTAYGKHGAKIPWSAAIDGTSGRLLALLCAAGDATTEARAELGQELGEALARDAVALPPPIDRMRALPGGWEFVPDPWWTALAVRATELLGMTGDHWRTAFREPERRERAFAELGNAVAQDASWRLEPAGQGAWLAARRDGDEIHLAIHTARQLDEALSGGGEWPAHGLLPAAFGSTPGLFSVVEGGPLEGTDRTLATFHPDPEATANGERRRVRLMRGGLLALAALIAFATAAAARMMKKARELHSLRATFVASVSHDLRTPLASIGLMAENLGSGHAKGREEVYVRSIQRETARLRRLVDDLLDFGRLERGLLPSLSRAPVDVTQWLDGVAARERARCAAKGAALSLETEGALGRASIDAPALERAISNLVDNALRHGEARSIRLRARRGSGAVLDIEVEDAGKGLGSGKGLGGGSVHEHLFEPFERRSEKEGTGLGLTIVRAIAEAHGGRATLSPGPNGRGVRARMEIRGCEMNPMEPAA